MIYIMVSIMDFWHPLTYCSSTMGPSQTNKQTNKHTSWWIWISITVRLAFFSLNPLPVCPVSSPHQSPFWVTMLLSEKEQSRYILVPFIWVHHCHLLKPWRHAETLTCEDDSLKPRPFSSSSLLSLPLLRFLVNVINWWHLSSSGVFQCHLLYC